MLGILRFFLIFILVVVLISYLLRFLFRIFFNRLGKRYGMFQDETQRKPEGEVHVSQKPMKDKVVDKNLGEYIDYEEVKDN